MPSQAQIKKASIVSVGNEVLGGWTVDTNAAHIARRLRAVNVPVVSIYAVPDDVEAIERVLALASAEADVVVTSGGLGPTDDDLTRQAIAGFLGVDLVLHPDLLAAIKHFFDRRGVAMPARNAGQARIPEKAKPIVNEVGTAPGVEARKGNTILFSLPGVPSEMERMLEASVLPRVREISKSQTIVTRRLKCFGAGESAVADLIGDAMRRGRNPLINCTVHAGVITLEVVATASDQSQAEEMATAEEASLRQALGKLVYGVGDQTLAEVVGERLVQTGKTVAVAESCTGGLLAKLITDAPGSSRYFLCGWVTYSNESKSRQLGVLPALIETHGAVSEQVAVAMAQGARYNAGADLAVGITGIAGPEGGTEHKPVGLVYIAVSSRDGTDISRYVFPHDRCFVRLRAAQTALDLLRLKI
ncbi:MAG: competence/damage-inducible protein A [Sedimentisphaerales bacterium]|nr:competence/damage-inducible protein A [Sedimentisphaerales bacterium]